MLACMRLSRSLVAAVCCASWLGCEDDSVCRSQCSSDGSSCVEQPFESFADVESGRALYEARCEDGALWAFEAECEDGTVILRSGTGYTSEGRFYDGDSGEFLGLTKTTDVVSPPCNGKNYWPSRVPCRMPVVTRVLCGTAFSQGENAGRGVTQ